MSVKEMKETLLKRIEASEDEQYIESLLEYSEVIKDESAEPVYKLSDAQRAGIRRGLEDEANGRVTTHEDLMREWIEWNKEADKQWADK